MAIGHLQQLGFIMLTNSYFVCVVFFYIEHVIQGEVQVWGIGKEW